MNFISKSIAFAIVLLVAAAGPAAEKNAAQRVFRAGAYAIDINPLKFPVIVNGSFTEQTATRVVDPLFARTLVLDDGRTRVAIVIVDNVALPEELFQQATRLVPASTGLDAHHIAIAATHTHSAPSVMPVLGSRADAVYSEFLTRQIARSIQLAVKNLEPAQVGWGVVKDFEHTYSRRWIKRLDHIGRDPFGDYTVRAMMHPGYMNPEYVGPSGPVDPDISLLSVQSLEGRPICLMANYSMHYYGSPLLSSDYYGQFAEEIKTLIAPGGSQPAFVGIMSQGTNGDLFRADYGRPANEIGYKLYAKQVAQRAYEGYQRIKYQKWVPLTVRESFMNLCLRGPSGKRLAWAKKIVERLDGRLPQTLEEVYAAEQFHMLATPQRRIRLQAICLGDLGITVSPTESYGLTGLKLKAASPLSQTINIDVACGLIGYIPPPEQYKFGGYNTWDTRIGCEVQTEPKVVEALLTLLEEASGKPRRKVTVHNGPYADAVLASKPVAYWRMEEMSPPLAQDATGSSNAGFYEDYVAMYLEGPEGDGFSGQGAINRAAHFAGGRVRSGSERLVGDRYSVEFWFWSGLPADARDLLGCLFARELQSSGDRLALSGAAETRGRLVFTAAAGPRLAGKAAVRPKTWTHVVLVRDREQVRVYLGGAAEPDLEGEAPPQAGGEIFVGGAGGAQAAADPFEGKIDEVSIYNRALPVDEIAGHFRAAAASPDTQQSRDARQ